MAEHAGIDDVFVYGVATDSGSAGEKDVVAAIVLNQDVGFDCDELFVYCSKKLPRNSVPRYLQVVNQIPKTASEKPLERFLLEQFVIDSPNVFTQKRETENSCS